MNLSTFDNNIYIHYYYTNYNKIYSLDNNQDDIRQLFNLQFFTNNNYNTFPRNYIIYYCNDYSIDNNTKNINENNIMKTLSDHVKNIFNNYTFICDETVYKNINLCKENSYYYFIIYIETNINIIDIIHNKNILTNDINENYYKTYDIVENKKNKENSNTNQNFNNSDIIIKIENEHKNKDIIKNLIIENDDIYISVSQKNEDDIKKHINTIFCGKYNCQNSRIKKYLYTLMKISINITNENRESIRDIVDNIANILQYTITQRKTYNKSICNILIFF